MTKQEKIREQLNRLTKNWPIADWELDPVIEAIANLRFTDCDPDDTTMRIRLKAIIGYKGSDGWPYVGEMQRAKLIQYLKAYDGSNAPSPMNDHTIRSYFDRLPLDHLEWVYNMLKSYIDYMLTHNNCPTCHKPRIT